MIENFTVEDAIAAKTLLITKCDKVGISDEISESKKGRQKKNILQKVIKDILDIWDVVDRLKGGQLLCNFICESDDVLVLNQSISEQTNTLDFQTSVIAALLDLKRLAETQNQSIKFLTNKVSNLYRLLD